MSDLDLWPRHRDHGPHHPGVRADPDARRGGVRGAAAARVRRAAQRAAGAARSAAGRARRRQAARLPARNARDSRRRLALRAGIRPTSRDRRVEITGPVDRKMIINALNSGAQRVHGRLRGRQHAALGQQHPGPAQPARRDPPPHRLRLARRQGVQAQRQDRGAVRAAARLAPAGEARADRRRADLRRHLRLRAVLLPQREGAASRAAAARTSTCRSSRAISRRGCGTTSS